MTDGQDKTSRVIRQDHPALNGIGLVVLYAFLAWPLIGFWVYWLRTGLWTIRGGTISDVGTLVWFGPLFLGVFLVAMSPRGPLRWLFEPPYEVSLDEHVIAWARPDGAVRSTDWGNVGGVATAGYELSWDTIVRDLAGEEVIRFSGLSFRDLRTGWKGRLPSAVILVRPDRYELVKGSLLNRRESAILRPFTGGGSAP